MDKKGIVQVYLERSTAAGIYDKYPDISDRAHWDYLSDELRTELIRAGEEASKEPWTQLLISDFLEFTRSGNRIRFEDKYFPRRRKLNSLVMAECAENKGRFVDDILDGLYLLMEESSWCLPPHNSYERDGRQEPVPDTSRPIIDLFQAESGAEVAFCEYLLRPVFAKVSPFISRNINELLEKRIFEPYLNRHFWWMGNGDEPMCNWTVWCTQNVLLCVLTREEGYFTTDERRRFLEKAAASCDFFLKDYGEDGCCSEGAQYYSHAGLCLFGCLELMDYAVRDGSGVQSSGESGFHTVFGEKIIRNIANYIVKMYAGNGYYINFADCSALPGRRTAREFLFGKATGDEALTAFAAQDFKTESPAQKLILDEINLFYHCMQAFAYDEMNRFKADTIAPEDSFFESTGLMVARRGGYVLAAKAGNNADSHNHNDVGSFTVYKDGKPFIIDLGVGTYTQKTFSDKRYEIWTMQSQYHNLPSFKDGDTLIMQHDGAEYGAKEVSVSLEERKASLSMEIQGAYQDERIKVYRRVVSIESCEDLMGTRDKNADKALVCVSDHYEGSLPAIVSIMTYERPVVTDEEELTLQVGDMGTIKISGARCAAIEVIPINDDRLGICWKHEVYRILLEVNDQSEELVLRL